MNPNETIPEKGTESLVVDIPLPHYQQKYNWDCGISCVLMVLPSEKRTHLINNLLQVCSDEGLDKSTWTIDLCYLLHRYGASHIYCTVTLGVHPDYINQNFYDRLLLKDEHRVNKRFTEAAGNGISIRKTSLSGAELRRHLSDCGPIILLTNANLIQCILCQSCHSSNWLTTELKACLPWKRGDESDVVTEYHGHYIVLCGYNLEQQCYFYRNPTFKDRICSMSFVAIDEARTSHGTDEDAILIFQRSWVQDVPVIQE